ncbi:hypothetical protein JUJ52_02410 [Virgibacillus sp. AGTR]|uniref:Uncharacterized protein n=1 Tax=Virgibacillus salarius TaxID=447199 RepID=A0A941I9L1_9BACI|nr:MULTISPECIES: hypothetical protein [Bacillaceae]MBR7794477.1 hypothetical protein [Virgibacillus salarius]MCC2248811.1 hypothetical protein [Virgibacillus sp. AGTR]MDY7043271.1 hypothetical protein [Virgibacillus sp. M23]QRZ17900.1 hypothetical protein JUJ52_19585 [Virgibacillus sp. AGTR]WBX78771.1 hypothetical protein PD280_12990 [Virgibacillus salarius]
MNYTSEMEKAMQQTHHIGFAEYERKLEKRLAIEKKRQQEHEKCKHFAAEYDGHMKK